MLRNQRGFTLTEMMVAVPLSLLLLVAAYLAVEHAQAAFSRTARTAFAQNEVGALVAIVAEELQNAHAIEVVDGEEPPSIHYIGAFSHRTVYGRDAVVHWRQGEEMVLTEGEVALTFESVPAEDNSSRHYRNALLIRARAVKDGEELYALQQVLHLPNLPGGTASGSFSGGTLWYDNGDNSSG